MTKACWVPVVLLLVFLIHGNNAEIHRAQKTQKSPTRMSTKTLWDDQPIEHNNTEVEWELFGHGYQTWVYSMVSSVIVGLSGIFPLLVIPLEAGKSLRHGPAGARLRILLGFAVGGLVGDVFLHLLPEAYASVDRGDYIGLRWVGFWVILGLLVFLVIEKIFPDHDDGEDAQDEDEVVVSASVKEPNGILNTHQANGHCKLESPELTEVRKRNLQKNGPPRTEDISKPLVAAASSIQHIKTSGWLNLTANMVDNFTHGLAVAGSYCVGTKVGIITTFAILIHEVPHEIGDFAILLRAGFDRWKAAKAQLLTASGALIGAITALAAESAKSAGDRTAWILPFTSGGFIYIALVTVVPDLLKETNPRESFRQITSVCAGVLIMAGVTLLCD